MPTMFKAAMEASHGERDDKILVIGPHTLYSILNEHTTCCKCNCKYRKELHSEFSFDFIDSLHLRTPSSVLKSYFGITEVFSVPVFHCFMAHALSLKHENGWSLVFSGDTLFCPGLITACPSPTVLIHEASFEDSLVVKAAEKAHCTIGQAVETGERMRARSTILTHFSQRYPKNLSLELLPHHNVAPAFDFMCVNLVRHGQISSCVKEVGENLYSLLGSSGDEDDEYVDVE